MKNVLGCDSSIPADKRLSNGYTMFDWVMRQLCFPAFWARTLLGENSITSDEVHFLNDHDCKIALVIRDLTEEEVSSSSGSEVALRAIEAAKALKTPQDKGIALFAEFAPDWSVNHNWMLSFATCIFNAGYVPGFIGNTDSSENFNFDRQTGHYLEASNKMKLPSAVFYATAPIINAEPTEWSPFAPSDMTQDEIHFWKTGKVNYRDISVDTVYARDDSVLNCMWNGEEK